jgi:hypothetical protein
LQPLQMSTAAGRTLGSRFYSVSLVAASLGLWFLPSHNRMKKASRLSSARPKGREDME